VKFYAGIGSRETPDRICDLMTGIAVNLRELDYTLRSGGAPGADRAFEVGAGPAKEIFRPEDTTDEALALAARYHPAWHRCSPYAKRLHARNGFQVLGRDLKTPSAFVVCWTKDGGPTGGTGQALRIAADKGVPIFNLHDPDAKRRLRDWVLGHADGVFA
jgi:hypothetical protein